MALNLDSSAKSKSLRVNFEADARFVSACSWLEGRYHLASRANLIRALVFAELKRQLDTANLSEEDRQALTELGPDPVEEQERIIRKLGKKLEVFEFASEFLGKKEPIQTKSEIGPRIALITSYLVEHQFIFKRIDRKGSSEKTTLTPVTMGDVTDFKRYLELKFDVVEYLKRAQLSESPGV